MPSRPLRRMALCMLFGRLAACTGQQDAAHAAAQAAAARQEETARVLGDQWASLAAVVPGEAAALGRRIDELNEAGQRGPNPAPDLDAARTGLRTDASLWSKAQAAFATGNMPEAVSTAIMVKSQLDALAASL